MVFEGNLNAAEMKLLIIVSRFNELITENLLAGAKGRFEKLGGDLKNIDLFYVPGAFEIGWAAKLGASSKRYDGIVCLGCVIRGGTPHFDYVAGEAASGISKASVESMLPVSFGILTTDTIEQAIERSGTKMGNKGCDAVESVVEMINAARQFNS